MNLLLVDDEPIIRNGISKIIEKNFKDINVITAENGEEAIKLFNENEISIALLDINMPKKDGLSVAEYMKEKSSLIKIVIITGYDNFEYTKKSITIGIDDYLLKPTTKDEIVEVIKRMIAKIENEIAYNHAKNILENSTILPENKGLASEINEIIENNYDKSYFSLNYLAEKLNMSVSYISSFFKKTYGINFQTYVNKKKMEKAAILLATTTLKNYEIAEKVGFENDGYYFNTRFKQYFGVTPKQYRASVLKGKKDED